MTTLATIERRIARLEHPDAPRTALQRARARQIAAWEREAERRMAERDAQMRDPEYIREMIIVTWECGLLSDAALEDEPPSGPLHALRRIAQDVTGASDQAFDHAPPGDREENTA
jgi:hypothetical protein